MDKIRNLGTDIQQITRPTFGLYAPLLLANKEFISKVKRETFSYGPHKRHFLDVYYPPPSSSRPKEEGRRTVLFFLYGGGLSKGHKTYRTYADGLVHANIGAFFAKKFGYVVVIPDYRLLSHGAKFPSGGMDLSLAVEWTCKHHPGCDSNAMDLVIMGNSAGGLHVCQYLFHPDFAGARAVISTGHGPRLRGVVLQSVSFDYHNVHPSRIENLKAFYGDYVLNAPLGQLNLLRKKSQDPLDFLKGTGTRILLLTSEMDPEDEILIPRDNFFREWLRFDDSEMRLALSCDTILGHNHVSPTLSLGTGIKREEAWSLQVDSFVKSVTAFPPPTLPQSIDSCPKQSAAKL